jgi:deoxyribodipyrimidine photo-lyase
MNPAIVWFRHDLRLADNPALHAATATKRPLVCVYICSENPDALASRHAKPHMPRSPGAASRWWLHGSLEALDEALAKHGGRLTLLRGDPIDTLAKLATATQAEAIYWNRRYDAPGRALDDALETTLTQRGIAVTTCNGHLLHEPDTIKNQSGKPFRVFTAYWRAALKLGPPEKPLSSPRKLRFHRLPKQGNATFKLNPVPLAHLALEPKRPDWAGGLRVTWTPDEPTAHAHLKRFLATTLDDYSTDRDRPDRLGTSRLSPYLAFGNISVRQIWHTAHTTVEKHPAPGKQRQLAKFLAELGWREFNYQILYHHPDLAERNFQSRFDPLRWRTDRRGLEAWQRGRTGYPIVDAGMRELWTTGWMHNRVRMVVASFLIKHLLIDWRTGEKWFWDTLVDADPANNAGNWQWVAGSGADAAPYFRIFNPILQGEKFDPQGDYVRRWVPELARLPSKVIHKPWTAKAEQLATAGVRLGKTYPRPVVDHDKARHRALLNVKSLA